MRAIGAFVAGLATISAQAAGVTLPGAPTPGAAFAGPSLIVSQTGPVTSGALHYDRTDVWRVTLTPGGSAGPAERLITVRTSAGRLTAPTLATRPDGAFALIARGPNVAPAVIWCCDQTTGLQGVVESDGRPGARIPQALWVGEHRVRYVTIQGDDARLVDTTANQAGAPPGSRMTSTPKPGLSAISAQTVWWVEAPAYGDSRVVAEGHDVNGEIRVTRRLPQPGVVQALIADDEQVVVVVRRAGGFEVRRATGASLWAGPRRPLVAAGNGRVAIATGRTIVVRSGTVVRTIQTRETVRALAVATGRVAWVGFTGRGIHRRTTIHWMAR